MKLSTFKSTVFDLAFFMAGRWRQLALAALIAIGLDPHLLLHKHQALFTAFGPGGFSQ